MTQQLLLCLITVQGLNTTLKPDFPYLALSNDKLLEIPALFLAFTPKAHMIRKSISLHRSVSVIKIS